MTSALVSLLFAPPAHAGFPGHNGRIAFTSRRHWKKDDEPLPSGLLGPVTLRAAVTRTLAHD